MNHKMIRGDIYYADLSGTVGCEQGGIRPVIILQNDIGNTFSPTTIVAPITSQPRKRLPTHVFLHKESISVLNSILIFLWNRYGLSIRQDLKTISVVQTKK